MLLGDIVLFGSGSYEIRAIVDGRYVVRIRNRKRNTESYEVWTSEEREQFDRKQERNRVQEDHRRDLDDRNRQMYERKLAGETYVSLGREFGIRPSRVSQICARQSRKERTTAKRGELPPSPIAPGRLSTTCEEWELAKPSPNLLPTSRLPWA